jgi:transcriptional regulator
MYVPYANKETRLSVMRSLITASPLATVVTMSSTGLFASHIPMQLHDDGSEFGVLQGHVARANSQWRDFDAKVDALAIFAGHQHYITPNWYPGKLEHGKEVPTWNYVVVHAYGPLKAIDDADWLLKFVTKLTDTHEARSPVPWKVSDAPGEFVQAMLKAIVGIEIPVRRMEGKWKVSQNRPESDREGVIQGLAELNHPESLAMKALVEKANEEAKK